MWNKLPEFLQNLIGIGGLIFVLLTMLYVVLRNSGGGSEPASPKPSHGPKDPFGIMAAAVSEVQEQYDIYRKRKDQRSKMKNDVDKGKWDRKILTEEEKQVRSFFLKLFVVVSIFVFLFLLAGGFLKGDPKVKSDEVVPLTGEVYVLEPKEERLDTTGMPEYRDELIISNSQLKFSCGEAGSVKNIQFGVGGEIRLANITGVETKIATPISLPGVVKVECEGLGIYTLTFIVAR